MIERLARGSKSMSLRIVVVGTGFGKRTVAPIYQSLGCEVEIVSPHDAKAVQAAIETPCDLVSIHSPPFLHLEHVRLATAIRPPRAVRQAFRLQCGRGERDARASRRRPPFCICWISSSAAIWRT
jgi:hypothetical protein